MIGVLVALLIALLTPIFLLVMIKVRTSLAKEEPVEKIDIKMFSAYTDCEQFQNVPYMETESGKISEAEDYGNEDFCINVSGSTVEEYKAYLGVLEKSGFKKHSDNGEDAMEGYAYTASYTKDNLVLTVSHAIKEDHTYLMAAFDRELSPYLVYQDSYMDGVTPDAKTSVHMLELHSNGNSFIIKLKNGHFVVHDGGKANDAPYFLDYIEGLVPEGEIPIIEAWFISHAHGDHSGALLQISKNMSDVKRLYVQGIYFVEPSDMVYEKLTMGGEDPTNSYMTSRINRMFKDENGEMTRAYRPQFGQRYYFCDIMVDVSLAMEQFPPESYYSSDFNDTSTWLMHHIEGQRFLIAGDTHHTGMRVAMNMFEEEYFDLDVFAVFHHAINVWDYFTDYCTYKTVLYTSWREASIWEPSRPSLARVAENEHLRQSCEEYVSHGNGTVVMTFPYKVGTYEVMKPLDWKYDNGVKGIDAEHAAGQWVGTGSN